VQPGDLRVLGIDYAYTIQIVTDGSDLAYTATLMSGTTILGSASLSGSGTFSLSFNPTITTATLTIVPTFGSHHSSSAHFINLQGIYLPRYNAGSMNVVSQVCDEDLYHYGYNGQKKDNEWAGVGNHNTALFWEYDTRTGRRANQDPKGTVWESPYLTFGDNPIENVDPLGDKLFHYNAVKDANSNTTLQLANVETVYKNDIVGYVYNVHSPSGRSPIYQTVEDTKDRYVVATQKYVYTDAGTGNRRVDYTTESTYDSYDEAYANRDHPNDMIGPFLVGLASMAHAHRMGETFGWHGAGGGSSVSPQEEPEITVPYKRPNNATTPAQRASVQGKPCVDCGITTKPMVADLIYPLVKEYYETGGIDLERMRSFEAVQLQCPTCSSKQGAELRKYGQEQKAKIPPPNGQK